MKVLQTCHRPIAVFGLALAILLSLSACGGGSNSDVTYSIGGTVSGLGSGKSLILQNNGGDDLTVTANGSFSFPTALGGGNTYNITVYTQPSDQTCTVANGSGILFGLDVTDISVTCTLNGHSVGGSVSGLQSGHSIVLQNNGGDDLTVGSNGDFTFATTLQSGAGYDVTILTPPSGQSCTLNNGSGTIAAADVDDVTVVCRTWQTAALIEHNDAGAAANPQIAMDTNGNAIAVWQQDDGASTNYIWANRFLAGSGWLTPVLIETTGTGTGASDPQIAVDGSGDAVAVWVQGGAIWSNRYTAGVGWGTAASITSHSGGETAPQIAIDSNGDAVAVWTYSGTPSEIWANHYSAGWGWGQAAAIGNNAGAADLAHAAMDSAGNAIAVWQQSDGTRTNIWANRYTPSGGWVTATLIENDNSGAAQSPRIAMNAGGDAVAVWQQNDGARFNILANRYTTTVGWEGATLIESDNTGDATHPVVAVTDDGNATAVWQQSDTLRTNIWANRYSSTGWGSATLIESDNNGDAQYPQIAATSNGDAAVVWQQYDGSRFNIWANSYSSAGWGSASLIETDNSGDALSPQVAAAAGGDTLAVWQQSDGALTNIWANSYR